MAAVSGQTGCISGLSLPSALLRAPQRPPPACRRPSEEKPCAPGERPQLKRQARSLHPGKKAASRSLRVLPEPHAGAIPQEARGRRSFEQPPLLHQRLPACLSLVLFGGDRLGLLCAQKHEDGPAAASPHLPKPLTTPLLLPSAPHLPLQKNKTKKKNRVSVAAIIPPCSRGVVASLLKKIKKEMHVSSSSIIMP